VAVALGAFDLEAVATLATFVGLPANLALGYGLFLVGGMTVWPLLFLSLGEYLPGELTLVTGLWYATVVSSGFALAFYTGQSGLELVTYLLFVLLGHWIYGLGLAGTITYLGGRQRRPSTGDANG
jgi:cytochrome c oxidase subunit 1